MTVAELLSVILGTLASVITAVGAYIIAWLHRKTKRLETEKNEYKSKKEEKEIQLQQAHNGFRDEVVNEIKQLKNDVELIKKVIIKEEKNDKDTK